MERSSVDLDDAVDDALQEIPIVRHEDERGARLEEPVLEPVGHERVEVVGGLVEEEHVGPRHQEASEGHTAPLAAGEGAAALVRVGDVQGVESALDQVLDVVASPRLEFLLEDVEAREQLLELRALSARRHGVVHALDPGEGLIAPLEPAADHVANDRVGVHLRLLLEVADAPAALHGHRALVGGLDPAEDLEQGGLPRAVATDESDAFAVGELEIDALEQGAVVEALGTAFEPDERHGGERVAAGGGAGPWGLPRIRSPGPLGGRTR